jgi:hypothetical protein
MRYQMTSQPHASCRHGRKGLDVGDSWLGCMLMAADKVFQVRQWLRRLELDSRDKEGKIGEDK